MCDYDMPIGCMDCEISDSVIRYLEAYVCMNCFVEYEEDEIGQCGWCSGLNAGNLEDSSLLGCSACGGAVEYHSL